MKFISKSKERSTILHRSHHIVEKKKEKTQKRKIMVVIVKCAASDEGHAFIAAVEQVILMTESDANVQVAFDCEGLNLSRVGTIELISICFSWMEVFLVDFHGSPDSEIASAVKQIFEHDKITKIIHDCRMDSDALYHRHGIKLTVVHDSSCFHHEITGKEDVGLNDVLQWNDLGQNNVRDKSIYKTNPNFWATRPVTEKMIEWATSDVDNLFRLAAKQISQLNDSRKERAQQKSEEYASIARDMNVVTGLRVNNVGHFIGRGGVNLRGLQHRTGTIMYQERPKNTWFVFYPNESALAAVKSRMMG
jgi:3'-5' exonuclease